ncbi:MAG: dephospho-CoA kinase [Actinomycetota bacterium]|nr:dephospho-CoA kinase [Actinomycetota bacterium]MCL6093654.1 dephospho-CoA kinase [Actinomycetota bacterium]MDA8166792.1 dephospho-CoA kinase [Actinomycetota bacterium]
MNPRANNKAPVRVALTGGIGSGKTTALAMFASRGAAVLSADVVVHELLERPDIRERVMARLGIEAPGGEAGRRRLAELVFGDDARLGSLEEVLFPLVRARITEWLASAGAAGAPAAVVEIPLLFESGMEDMFDQVVLITAPEEVRRKRYGGRASTADFARRARRQLPEEEKRSRAQVVFENTGLPGLMEQFVAGLMAAYGSGAGA